MKLSQNIQCQSCGASSVIKHHEKSLLECRYCGAMISFRDQANQTTSPLVQRKPAKIGLMLILLPVIVIVLMVIFWVTFQNIRKQTDLVSFEDELSVVAEQNNHGNSIHQGGSAIKPLAKVLSQPQHSSLPDDDLPIHKYLQIESQVSGITSNEGQYWIFGVKNTSKEVMVRPGVMVSLFDQAGQRLAEQGGWSLKESLQPGDNTTVLVFLSDVPDDVVNQQVQSLASKPNSYGLKQVSIEVQDYKINNKNKRYEIIGDVTNELADSVKYTRIVAVAYNADKEPIGIGNAFSTVKDLAPNQRSGFKVNVGTFLTEAPVSWQLWAVARAQ